LIELYDQIGNKLLLADPAKRIVSLVPSITELLSHFHLDAETIGITKFCELPEAWHKSKTRIGGTKQIDIEKIRSLHPDLIIANKEENIKEQVETLSKEYPVYVSDVNELVSALQMIKDIALLTGKEDKGLQLLEKIREGFEAIPTPGQAMKVCYLIWQKPYMTVGGDTFINAMLQHAGCSNVFQDQHRYPEVSVADILESGCNHILLSSEPFPFQQKHADELRQLLSVQFEQYDQKLPTIQLVDGQMFSWYGSRLLDAPAYFCQLQKTMAESQLSL
jgi:ABC-type Fe3+-hydroxamate transport system substrate-binding protein